jgi:hypothetical protein
MRWAKRETESQRAVEIRREGAGEGVKVGRVVKVGKKGEGQLEQQTVN